MTAPLYGADDHLDKPFLIDELLERLRQLSERKAADRPAQLA
jgi:DNA-binding response OmpR family regulator